MHCYIASKVCIHVHTAEEESNPFFFEKHAIQVNFSIVSMHYFREFEACNELDWDLVFFQRGSSRTIQAN